MKSLGVITSTHRHHLLFAQMTTEDNLREMRTLSAAYPTPGGVILGAVSRSPSLVT
jgi:hypothetical protein